jgi:predicted transcriptional regulator
MQDPGDDRTLLNLTVQIVGAYVAIQKVPLSELGVVLRSVHATIRSFHDEIRPTGSKAAAREPAVPIDRSVTPEYLVCLEDGRRLKTLKRHLRAAYGLTPEAYRTRWGLPPDYPMVAPGYAKRRSSLARAQGLGTRRGG